jgi:hypothetical protein
MAGTFENPPAGGRTTPPRSARVAELGLVAAGLGLLVYLLGFGGLDVGAVPGALLLAGGLLSGSVALSVGGGVLAPAAAVVVAGALLALQGVLSGSIAAVEVGGVVLALLEAAAASAAALLHAGARRAPRARKAAEPPQPAHPGSYPEGPYPGDQYAGEHAYAQHARYGGQYGVPGYPPPPYAPGRPPEQETTVTASGRFGAVSDLSPADTDRTRPLSSRPQDQPPS